MRRRRFLTGLSVTAMACPLCAATVARAADGIHWGYGGTSGPSRWASLAKDFQVCGAGAEQSPVDLDAGTPAILTDVGVDWQPCPLSVLNNGHTIQVNTAAGCSITLDGKAYRMKQFHFHHPSEHLIDGRAQAMEAHFVHVANDGDVAVLGVFMVPGEPHDTVETVWQVMPRAPGLIETDAAIMPQTLLPSRHGFWRYAGSLTTPPCDEIVTWTVYADPIEISADQIRRFAAIFPNNARPAQTLNRRFLLRNF